MNSKTNLILILTMLLLTLACATTARKPYVEVIVSEDEKPAWFLLSPDRHRMLYGSGASYYVLNLDTREKVNLTKLNAKLGPFLYWMDNRYIYDGRHARLVVDTEIWQVYSIEEFSPQEQPRFEQAWQRQWEQKASEVFEDGVRYYSPDGRYYFVGSRTEVVAGKDTVGLYAQDGQELAQYRYEEISLAAWAHDSSGVYVLPEERVGWWGRIGKGIVKLRVPQE